MSITTIEGFFQSERSSRPEHGLISSPERVHPKCQHKVNRDKREKVVPKAQIHWPTFFPRNKITANVYFTAADNYRKQPKKRRKKNFLFSNFLTGS
jgi:hypothetical protein